MNAERLLAHYHEIADAPDAIARLRRFVLDLAVRGKLVPQDAGDEPASELLRRSDKGRPQASFKESRTDNNETSDPEYDLPANWLWVRIGDHLELINGMAFKPTDWKPSGIKIVRIQNLNRPDAPFNYCDPTMVRDRFLINDGAFLISWSGTPGTSFGAFIWERGEAVLNQHIFRCDFRLNAFDPLYLRLAINGRLDEMIAKAHGGVGLQHITKGKLEALLIALPPLAEQRRIVVKFDELMRLCDRLEAARGDRESVRDRLEAASLTRLSAPDSETFQADARFALDALPALTTRPDQIQQLRQTILKLAVFGKLVPQDPKDEPASELLDKLLAQKSKGQRGRDWTAGMSDARGQMFKAPVGWAWTRIADTCERVTVGYVGPMKDQYVDIGIPFLRSQNVRANRFREEGLIYISPHFHKKIIKSALVPGDVVVVRSGNVGTACVIPETIPEANCSDLVVVQRPQCVLPTFLCFYLNSLAALHVEAGSVGVALTHFNTKSVATMPLPLPPLAEQHRIVAKVDSLVALCDRLEACLTATAATRRRLLDALLAEALAPTDDRKLEAAE
ncbi:restriction endonuclease subunit S [Bradyrhizobium sp. 1200_D9_N1_1]|uniref:restriction endonuclease subunit S n=1 Tax=Bradyrhizobium sp. 1200_D9_N1_1 TaxID=3239013 RepID=UPI003F898C55